MHHRMFTDEDGNDVHEFDLDGIDFFLDGLIQLRHLPPDSEIQVPVIKTDDETGVPTNAQYLILRRKVDGASSDQ